MLRSIPPILLVLAGCSSGDPGPTPAPTELVFEANAPSEGSAIYLDGELDEAGLELSVWAREAGDVFGIAAHLVHDVEILDVDADAPLGSDDEALHLVVEGDADLSIGGTRLSPSLGDVSLEAPTRLATLRLAQPSEPTSFFIDRITVRRSDGSFVPTSGYGAAIVEREVGR
jgi:hypothetical protein